MSFDPNALLLSLVVSSVGMGIFVYGKKQARFPQLVAGAVLTLYTYFVSNLAAMAVIAIGVLGLLWAVLRLGV